MSPSSTHLTEQIDLILKHEEEFLARRTAAERLGDTLGAFVGSLKFVALHVAWFATWIVMNTVPQIGAPQFDPA